MAMRQYLAVGGLAETTGEDAVYVFSRAGGTWALQIEATSTGSGEGFGRALSLAGDGSRLAIGASGESSSARGVNGNRTGIGSRYSGAAFIFSRDGSAWTQEAFIKATNIGDSDAFVRVLAMSGDGQTLAVGAVSEDSSSSGVNAEQEDERASGSGAVYVH